MTSLSIVARGRVWKVGDSIDTTQLAGGGLRGSTQAETLRINCLRGVHPQFTDGVRPGDILVAGTNFGCGSSRQTAVEALQLCGISAVLCESLARIHGRNSIAKGLPTYVVSGISAAVDEGDEVEVDYPARVVRVVTKGMTLPIPRFPGSVEDIYESGGLVQMLGKRLADEGFVAPLPPITELLPTPGQ
jgi:3-isopropylmalate/(R)-2-methylmalate dehydratase small subunit